MCLCFTILQKAFNLSLAYNKRWWKTRDCYYSSNNNSNNSSKGNFLEVSRGKRDDRKAPKPKTQCFRCLQLQLRPLLPWIIANSRVAVNLEAKACLEQMEPSAQVLSAVCQLLQVSNSKVTFRAQVISKWISMLQDRVLWLVAWITVNLATVLISKIKVCFSRIALPL